MVFKGEKNGLGRNLNDSYLTSISEPFEIPSRTLVVIYNSQFLCQHYVQFDFVKYLTRHTVI